MNISCEVVKDLLPLFVEDSCSPESARSVAEHLDGCPECHKIFEDMICDGICFVPDGVQPVLDYQRRIHKHRVRTVCFVIIAFVIICMLTSLCLLGLYDMKLQMRPVIFETEAGTTNLTANKITVSAENADEYRLYTNSTMIKVEIASNTDFSGEIQLISADNECVILSAETDESSPNCIFTNLTSARRYYVRCIGLDGLQATIDDGREVSFISSLKNVINQLLDI